MEECGVSSGWVKEILNMRNIVTISAKRKTLYISKYFREKLQGEIRITINQDNPKELILRESGEGECRMRSGCARLWSEIQAEMDVEDKVRFMFFRSEDRSHWIGYMLPSWEKSFLWRGIEEQAAGSRKGNGSSADLTLRDRTVIYCICGRYLRLLEYDEAENCCRLGKLMAEVQGIEPGRRNVLQILYANELIRHIVRVTRRYSRIETEVSLNAEIADASRDTYENFWGTEDVHYKNLELTEFRGWLTAGQRLVLRMLEHGMDMEKNFSMGVRIKDYFLSAVNAIRERVFDYFGRDYIRSMLAH